MSVILTPGDLQEEICRARANLLLKGCRLGQYCTHESDMEGHAQKSFYNLFIGTLPQISDYNVQYRELLTFCLYELVCVSPFDLKLI